MGKTEHKVKTCLWFDDNAEEAVRFYVSLFPDSEITLIERYGEHGPGEPGSVMLIEFTLAGTPYQALNTGSQRPFTEAASISVLTEDQEETDRVWAALTADGGREVQCSWLKDRFGLSWQIVPRRFVELRTSDDPQVRERAMKAMMGMVKIDIAEAERAALGD